MFLLHVMYVGCYTYLCSHVAVMSFNHHAVYVGIVTSCKRVDSVIETSLCSIHYRDDDENVSKKSQHGEHELVCLAKYRSSDCRHSAEFQGFT